MKKDNKNMIIWGIVAVVVAIAVIVGVVLVIKSKPSGSEGQGEETGQIDGGSETQPSTFDNVDVSVGFGDYDVMFAQAKAIQNGEMVGMIIQVDGIVSHPMSRYSITEKNEKGEVIGTEFIIEGLDESEYPQDGSHVVITGEVIEKEPLYYIIRTTPEYVELISTSIEDDETVEMDELEIDAADVDEGEV